MKYILAVFALLAVHSCQDSKVMTYEEGMENCNRILEEKAKAHPNGYVYDDADCIIGYQIPAFEGTTRDGKKINREQLVGKLSIINFWFITCAPCVAEIPGLNAITEQYGTTKINYIAIGRDNSQDITEFLQEHPWKFEHITDANDIIRNHFKLRWGYPTTFLLNKKAEIIATFFGGNTDSAAVEEIQKSYCPSLIKNCNKDNPVFQASMAN